VRTLGLIKKKLGGRYQLKSDEIAETKAKFKRLGCLTSKEKTPAPLETDSREAVVVFENLGKTISQELQGGNL